MIDLVLTLGILLSRLDSAERHAASGTDIHWSCAVQYTKMGVGASKSKAGLHNLLSEQNVDGANARL